MKKFPIILIVAALLISACGPGSLIGGGATPVAEATPTAKPTAQPTAKPTAQPTAKPTAQPTAKPTAQPTAAPTKATATQGCPGARFTRYDRPTDFTVQGPSIVHPYRDGQPQFRVLIRAGETLTFASVKGDRYNFENTEPCNNNMDFEFAKGAGAYPAKTVEELRAMGWVR